MWLMRSETKLAAASLMDMSSDYTIMYMYKCKKVFGLKCSLTRERKNRALWRIGRMRLTLEDIASLFSATSCLASENPCNRRL